MKDVNNQPRKPDSINRNGYLCAIVGVSFTIAIMFEGASTKKKKKHNIFDEKDIY